MPDPKADPKADSDPTPAGSEAGHVSSDRDVVSETTLTPPGDPDGDRAVTTQPEEKPYSAFSKSTKWFIVGLGGIAGIFSPISSNIFVPAIPVLARDFNTSESQISLAVTVYLVFQATTPSFFGALSDSYGRRPVYIMTLVIYIGANIGLALTPTSAYWLLLVLRAVQATGGSAVIAIGAGSVADIAEPREKGTYLSVFSAGLLLGPAFGPLLGGVFAETLSWRAIFWFLAIATAVVLIPLIFFLPETLRSLVGDGSLPPPRINSSPQQLWQRYQAKKHGEIKVHVDRPPRKKFQPLSAFMILFTPEIILVFIFVSLQYAEFYAILTIFSTALKNSYGLNELQIGLCYLPSGIATIISAITTGRLADRFYRREESRVGGDYRKKGDEFRLERARFITPVIPVVLFLVASIALGWCLEVKAPLAATLVVNFFVGLGAGATNLATVYGQDLNPGKGGAVSASLNLVRCLFGAVATAVIQLIYNAINPGWTFVLLSGIITLSFPIPIFVLKRARFWRERRKERKDKKRSEKAGSQT